jgi:hypothetical protein
LNPPPSGLQHSTLTTTLPRGHAFNKKEDLGASGENQERACPLEEDGVDGNIPFSRIIIQETGHTT